MIYLDNAATTLYKPRAVEESVRRAMQTAAGYARGGYAAAVRAGELVYHCREQIAALFGVNDPARVVFTLNATQALNYAIHALVPSDTITYPVGGSGKVDGKASRTTSCPRVVVSGYEHNAVIRPLRLRGITPLILDTPLWDTAAFLQRAKDAIAAGATLFIITHVSNVFGYILPLDELATLLTDAGIPLILDASQSAGMIDLDVKRYPCLAAVGMPGHKGLYGPQGTGVLLALDDRLARHPLLAGGTGSLSAEWEQPDFLPDALESGTPNVPGIAGLAAGVAFVRSIGPANIGQQETALIRAFVQDIETLQQQDRKAQQQQNTPFRIECFTGAPQAGVISFRVPGVPSEELAEVLAQHDIAVRAGLHCAPVAHQTAGTLDTGTVRVSVSFYSTLPQIHQAAEVAYQAARLYTMR